MSCNPCSPFCPTLTVFDPPVTVVNDVYHPQLVEVVHQINVVNKHHCVPVEKHLYKYDYSNVAASESDVSNNSYHDRSRCRVSSKSKPRVKSNKKTNKTR